MMRMLALLGAGVLLAGCERPDPVAEQANNTAGLPTLNEPAPSAQGEPPRDLSAQAPVEAPPTVAAAAIPAALHGRWGLTPQDCTSTRGDAKGLLTITADGLRFYESRAVPATNIETSADSISADFAFTGEGMTWTKFQTLQRQGVKLVRTESNPMASFTYARCD